MTSNISSRPPRRKTANGSKPKPTQSPSYAPSVPISVYRELAAELQAAKGMVDSLSQQNQQLSQQNQQLRLEIEKVAQLSLQLQQIAESYQPFNLADAVTSVHLVEDKPAVNRDEFVASAMQQSTAPRIDAIPISDYLAAESQTPDLIPLTPPLEKLHTEQKQDPKRLGLTSKRASEMSGWFLVAAIVLIVMTAFGAGFLVVRSLLPAR